MNGPPNDDGSDIRKWAARAWLEMESAGVLPTPRNFDLWFSHVSGANPDLTRQIGEILAKQPVVTAATLDDLHAMFGSPDHAMDQVADQAEAIQQAAQLFVTQLAGNGEQLQEYGNALSLWSARLSQDRTLETLLQAVSSVLAETARASERNRALEHQLSASAARITRLKDSIADLKREATVDVLTGLCNRKAFTARLRKALADAKADGSAVSLLMIDVDHFKRVNDTYGHPTGDLFLRLIGRVLSESIKGRDISARYGGEEFAVLLVKANLKAGTTVANEIRMVLEKKQIVRSKAEDQPMGITVSIGVAQFRTTETAASLIDRADVALYQAKALGRNRVCAAQ
nr:GGDEF domain-containing protein [uncultured Rhodopila sp.]